MQKCEECGQEPSDDRSLELFDYCAECSRNLCDGCMAEGCCGNKPARSGMDEDN